MTESIDKMHDNWNKEKNVIICVFEVNFVEALSSKNKIKPNGEEPRIRKTNRLGEVELLFDT